MTDWRVSLSDVVLDDAEIDAVTAVLRSRWLSAGPETAAFEAEFAARLGADDAVAVSSGTAALHLAVLALGLTAGDEVILPSLSFVAAAAVCSLHGIRPVFADVTSLEDLTVDPADVAARITPRTRAIVAMHYGGFAARVGALRRLADRHGLALIEDAAHAPVVHDEAGMLGTVGDIGCFSFFATKNVATGEGGMVVARDPALRERVRRLRSHAMTTTSWDKQQGRPSAYDVTAAGLNYRPQELSSALGRVQLRRLPDDRRRRRALTGHYAARLARTPIIVPFHGPTAGEADSAFHLMAVVLPEGTDRARVQEALRRDGIQSSVHYPPTHLFAHYRSRWGTEPGSLPVTEAVGERQLTLPLHARMTLDDVDLVVEHLAGAVSDAR